MEMQSDVLDVPSCVWQHSLFRDSAEYIPFTDDLAIAWCDARLRRLRHMPSTADQSRIALLDAVQALHKKAMSWLEALDDTSACQVKEMLRHLERLTGPQSNNLSDVMYFRAVNRLKESLPLRIQSIMPKDSVGRDDLKATLHLIPILLVDRFFRENKTWEKRYLKAAYRYADAALQYNATTDLTRIRPVLSWIHAILLEQGRTGCSYIDVGCAVAAGAPTVVLAGEILRQGEVVADIHGTDIVLPARDLVEEMLRVHRIQLYSSNPVSRPLPIDYDVILLSNVHRHLTRTDQQQIVQNLGMSMKDEGLLFINWRFNERESPCICLQKTGQRLDLVKERNCI